jgi:hypothetical protein
MVLVDCNYTEPKDKEQQTPLEFTCFFRQRGVEYGQIIPQESNINMTSQFPSIADIPMPDSIPEDSHWSLWSQ